MSDATEGSDPDHLLDTLQALWQKKDIAEVRAEARDAFSRMADPYDGLLQILERCGEVTKSKGGSLAHCLLGEFQQWLKKGPHAGPAHPPDMSTKLRALKLIVEKQPTSLEAMVDIFLLGTLERGLLVQHLHSLLQRGKYKEVVLFSVKLNLQSELEMEKVCVPLILMDKLQLAETFVSHSVDLQRHLLRLLDSWCARDFDSESLYSQYPGSSSSLKTSRLNPSVLRKQVFRLMERLKVDAAFCPNVVAQRRLASLSFLMYKRFVEKSMSEEDWEDHVQSTVGDDQDLQQQLIHLLVRNSDLRTAARWASRYAVPKELLPLGVDDYLEGAQARSEAIGVLKAEDSWGRQAGTSEDTHYQLPIALGDVHLVDTAARLEECREVLLKPDTTVGLDMEWRPSFGSVSRPRVSLIQLAVRDAVYLLDLLALERGEQTVQLVGFMRSLFLDPSITKLGYGLDGDLRTFAAMWPELQDDPIKSAGMLDLLGVHKRLMRSHAPEHRACRPTSKVDGPPEKGLSLLVQLVLGKRLNKSEQLSNWERRPLLPEQVRYAAIDAYCLLDVYHKLSQESPSVEGLCQLAASPSAGEKDYKRKPKQSGAPEQPPVPSPQLASNEPLCPGEFRVVCDNMLQGLGRYLRCVGVDVKILDNDDDHRQAAEIARREGRVILTCGMPYQKLSSQVAAGRCLYVSSSEKAREQALQVIRHFNVQVTQADIFSRCQACNGDEYLKLLREDMAKLIEAKGLMPLDDQAGLEVESPGTAERSLIQRYTPKCRWASASQLDQDTLHFPSGARLQVETVPPGLLDKVDHFYCCTGCGKVFWEGSHFGRVLAQFQEVLQISDDRRDLLE
ncbi:exonuclease mut-7 homolog [Erpetoichthys calabaricus]|uniref:exonuclease mut-7 homolog n=1 Tax=Erpetoichthys calabaricus TaxID=27687 RepID=UPI0022347251|nr:exonuclease mut-7 homolog [Erpetoichthys calabaricus]